MTLTGRIGITPNRSSFRFGGLRTHLAAAAFVVRLAGERRAMPHLIVRIDDTNASRTQRRHEQPLLDELTEVGQIPLSALGMEGGTHLLRQSDRAERHRAVACLLRDRGLALIDADGSATVCVFGSQLADMARPPTEATRVRITRAGGRPLWHLAAAVDDADHRVGVCVRGVDKMAAEPVQRAIITALGATPPDYYYLPKMTSGQDLALIAEIRRAGFRDSSLFSFLAASLCPGADVSELRSFNDLARSVPARSDRRSQFNLDWGRLNKLDRQISAGLEGHLAARELHGFCQRVGDRKTTEFLETHPVARLLELWRRPLASQHALVAGLAHSRFEPPRAPATAALLVRLAQEQTLMHVDDLLDRAADLECTGSALHEALRWLLTGSHVGPDYRAIWDWHVSNGSLAQQIRLARSALEA